MTLFSLVSDKEAAKWRTEVLKPAGALAHASWQVHEHNLWKKLPVTQHIAYMIEMCAFRRVKRIYCVTYHLEIRNTEGMLKSTKLVFTSRLVKAGVIAALPKLWGREKLRMRRCVAERLALFSPPLSELW